MALSLAVEMPSCERAARSFSELMDVPVSASMMKRLVKAYGREVVEAVVEEAEAMVRVLAEEELRLFLPPHRNPRLAAHAAIRLADRDAGHGSGNCGSLGLGQRPQSRLGSQSTAPFDPSHIASLSQPCRSPARTQTGGRLPVEKPATHELRRLSQSRLPHQ